MKKEDLFRAMEDLDEKDIREAGEYRADKRAGWRKWGMVLLCAAVCLVAVIAGPKLLGPGGGAEPKGTAVNAIDVSAVYPEPTAAGQDPARFMEGDEHWEWWQDYLKTVERSRGMQKDMNGYTAAILRELLTDEEENTVCSPLNTYIALAMLAEVTDGNSRAQILDALQVSDVQTLRTRVQALWQSNYVQTPVLNSVLGNSLWLNESQSYHEEPLRRLADIYYASSYSGKPGSEEMNEKLRKWTDFQTGGLLSEYVKNMSLDPQMVLDLISTVYYSAQWSTKFQESLNTRETFHGTKGDTTVEMMHLYSTMRSFHSDQWTGTALDLMDSGMMYFLLPEKGVSVNDLLNDSELLSVLAHDEEESWYPLVDLSLPKFRVSAQKDLADPLKKLGITDVLDPLKADFTPLSDLEGISLSTAMHTAMVEIDENGVTGAAYTELMMAGAGMPDEVIKLVLDRPFVFLVTGEDGSLLFAGAVRNITE